MICISFFLVCFLYCAHVLTGEDGVCSLTGSAPSAPRVPLKFCSMFYESSCCDSGQDAQIESFYTGLTGVSNLCTAQWGNFQMSLQFLYCFGCSPNEPVFAVENIIRICPSLANTLDPASYDDCGLNVPTIRGDSCAPTNLVHNT